LSGRMFIIFAVLLCSISCDDNPASPDPDPDPQDPTASVLAADFNGWWIPPDTSKSISKTLELSWSMCPDSNFLQYTLYRSDSPGIQQEPDSAHQLTVVLSAEDTSFTDPDVQWDSTYYYAVETTNSSVLHSWSNELTVVIPPVTAYGGPDHLAETVPVGAGPGGVTSIPGGSEAWAACYYDNSIYVVSPEYPYVMASFGLNGGPFDMCAGNGRVYVSCSQSDEVVSIGTSSYSVESSVAVGDMPLGLCLTPDGQRLYVCCYEDGSVWCLDASSLALMDTVATGEGPWDITASPSGQYIYVSCRLDGKVQAIRTSDNSVVASLNVSEPTGVGMSIGGDYVYACSYSTDRLLKIRTSDYSVVSYIDVGSRPMNVAATPNGLLAYVSCYFDDRVDIVDLSEGTVAGRLEAGTRPNGLAFTSEGDYFYVAGSSSGTVKIFDYYEVYPAD